MWDHAEVSEVVVSSRALVARNFGRQGKDCGGAEHGVCRKNSSFVEARVAVRKDDIFTKLVARVKRVRLSNPCC